MTSFTYVYVHTSLSRDKGMEHSDGVGAAAYGLILTHTTLMPASDERLLYLDPHEVQPALRSESPNLGTCHFRRGVRTMKLAEIDPSLALGFLLSSEDEFGALCDECARLGGESLAAFSVASRCVDIYIYRERVYIKIYL